MELHLHYIFAFVCGTMLAASVGATGDSRLKRSEDSSPDESREIRLEDGRGKKSYCHGICELIRVPEKSCREVLEKRLPKIWLMCENGNVEWSKPSEGVERCLLSCRMTPAECNNLCWKRCKEECHRRFPHRDAGAGINQFFCRRSCATEIQRTAVRRFVGGKGV